MTGNWDQIWIWFEGKFKGFRVEIKFLKAVFDWISKQQLNLLLFLSDWYWGKLGLTDLPSHDWKVTSDKKIVFISYQIYKCENGDYCSHFSMIFETTSKLLIVFVRLILRKVGVDGVTGPWWEISIRYEFDLKVTLKSLRCK